jgi:hypothetical protein
LKKEKSASSVFFSKGSGTHTALLDFTFFDHIAKIEEKAKETSKMTRLLTKLFPNRITINPPSKSEEVIVKFFSLI